MAGTDLSKLRAPTPRQEPVSDAHIEVESQSLDFAEVVRNYNLIDVTDDGVVLVTPRDPNEIALAESSTKPHTTEGGYAMSGGTSYYDGVVKDEYNANLRGLNGLRIFDEMRRSDAQVRSSLRVSKTPVIAGKWYIAPASQSPQDRTIAEFVDWNLRKGMSVSWIQVLIDALLMLDFGYYAFEKVYYYKEWRGERRTCWRKWAPRHPVDTESLVYDANGGLQKIVQLPNGERTKSTTLNIEDLLVFTFEKESGNAQGVSILRSAYQSWYYKKNLYKIDAIQKERHGIGIPIIKLPPQYNDADKVKANEIGRNLRTNESAHVVLPMGWEVLFAEIKSNPVDVVKSIEHHDLQIAKNVLAGFLHTDSTGNQEQAESIFLKGSRFIADIIRDVVNKYAIPQLVDFNWDVEDYPELRVRRIGETVDWRTLSMALRNLVGSKIIQPDTPLEQWARYEMDLPEMDPTTTREVATPQLPEDGGDGADGEQGAPDAPEPPNVGPPRQSTAGAMTNKPNTGRGDSPRTA